MVMAAILLPALIAMAGMAIDVGSYASDRRTLQNAADSMALAAGQELPDAASAQAKAYEYAAEHDIDVSDVTVTVTGGSTQPAVRVVIDRSHDFAFMGIVGIEEADVGAIAAAGKFSFGGGAGVVPWSIEEETVNAANSGDEVIIKYDASGPAPGQGNFGTIRIDGSGSSDYEESAKYGSDYNVCSTAMSNCATDSCPASYPTICGEDSPECDGPECPPKTGNMTGGTRDAVDFRMDNTGAECDTFDEVFTSIGSYSGSSIDPELFAFDNVGAGSGGRLAAPGSHHGAGSHPTYTPTLGPPTNTPTKTNTPAPTNTPVPTSTPSAATNTPAPTNTPGSPAATNTPGSGSGDTYALNGECNPWSGGACETATSLCSRRVFLIPIISSFGNGASDPVEIRGFALVYLEGYDGTCTGESCDVKVRFVKADVTMGGFAGDYDPDALNHFVKLIE
jgi:putative Flp pilus-assembly TadE/G-like protein